MDNNIPVSNSTGSYAALCDIQSNKRCHVGPSASCHMMIQVRCQDEKVVKDIGGKSMGVIFINKKKDLADVDVTERKNAQFREKRS